MSPNELQKLIATSETLNRESNEINSTISAINDKLAAANLGIEVWYESGSADGSSFGYAKVSAVTGTETTWQLSYKRTNNSTEYPLFKAPRDLRIEALDHLPTLIKELQYEAEKRIASIKKAKEVVAQL
jgi:hypothetical protein